MEAKLQVCCTVPPAQIQARHVNSPLPKSRAALSPASELCRCYAASLGSCAPLRLDYQQLSIEPLSRPPNDSWIDPKHTHNGEVCAAFPSASCPPAVGAQYADICDGIRPAARLVRLPRQARRGRAPRWPPKREARYSTGHQAGVDQAPGQDGTDNNRGWLLCLAQMGAPSQSSPDIALSLSSPCRCPS